VESTVAQVVRVTPGVHWHALEDDLVVGRAYALHRPDGRVLVSVDSWRDDVFDLLARAMADDLGSPLYTVVDDDDREHLGRWAMQGYRDHRREDEYAVPTDDRPDVPRPAGIVVRPADRVDEARLRRLDEQLRQDVPGSRGWVNEPARFHEICFDPKVFESTTFLVAIHRGEYAGLVRIARAGRRPRLALVGVHPAHRGRGLGKALLAEAFRPLRQRGVTHVIADADETNAAAQALFKGFHAERTGGAVELVKRF
jgi:ribosomal protein S18 acetylase RimI-like enzyme